MERIREPRKHGRHTRDGRSASYVCKPLMRNAVWRELFVHAFQILGKHAPPSRIVVRASPAPSRKSWPKSQFSESRIGSYNHGRLGKHGTRTLKRIDSDSSLHRGCFCPGKIWFGLHSPIVEGRWGKARTKLERMSNEGRTKVERRSNEGRTKVEQRPNKGRTKSGSDLEQLNGNCHCVGNG